MRAFLKRLDPVITILVAALVICLALARTFYDTGIHQLDSQQLLELHHEAQVGITDGHLWLEQLLAGDRRIDPDVQIYRPFLRAATNLMSIAASPLLVKDEDARLAQSAAEGCRILHALARQRVSVGDAAKAGSPADIEFETEYHRVGNRLDQLKAAITHRIANLHSVTRMSLHVMLGATLFILIALAALVSRSRNEARRQATELKALVEERTEQLQGMTSQLKGVADSVVDAIITSDWGGRVTSLNLAAIKMFGYAPAELLGQPVTLLMPAHLRAAHEAGMNRVLAAGPGAQVARRVEVTGRHRDGQEFPVEITLTVWQARTKGGFTALIRDITAQRKSAEKLAADQREIEELNEELAITNASLQVAARHKDLFLAAMSHELRTPLTVILSYSQLLHDQVQGPLNERQAHYVTVISQSGQHLLNLISEVLDLAKIDAGKLALHLDTVHLGILVRTSLQMMEPLAREKRLRLHDELPVPLPSLRGDPQRITQILINLLSNAVKFTPDGGSVTLTVAMVPEGGLVRITVADTGIGIAEEHRARLFQPFVQIDSKLSRQHGGTGLGLALIAKLAGLHGGSVSVESKVGSGSRFHVTLPLAGPPQPSDLPPVTAIQ